MSYVIRTTKNVVKRRKELAEVKEMFGVSGHRFVKRPYFGSSVVPTECKEMWNCQKLGRGDDDIIEVVNTHPQTLHKLLDGLLNLEENPNPPEISFGGKIYNNLDDLWKAMGKI